jgi:hypothetical protein
MTGQQLYTLFIRLHAQIMHSGVEDWDLLTHDEQLVFNEMAKAIAVEFDPSADRAQLLERAESAECVVRQVARDTYGEDLSVKEFADRSGYDS